VRGRARRVWILAAVAAAFSAAAVAPSLAAQGSQFRPAVSGRGGVVATESLAAARVGRNVLERGGNAVDAAVATVFAMSVARPQSCGIGGGGFMVYRDRRGRSYTLDFRETAPAAIRPDTYVPPGLHKQFTGHLTVGVPGTVAGMSEALRRFGTWSWRRVIGPAERLARNGVPVSAALSLAMAQNADRLKLFPAAAQQFLVDGRTPYAGGAIIRQLDLAGTLRRLQRGGPRAFYRGTIARRIVADMQARRPTGEPGLITLADLAAYRAKWRTPLVGSYRGAQVIAMPPPTSGGIAILEMLNLLEGFDLRSLGMSSADELHLLAEAQKLAFADRGTYVADPDQVQVPTGQLISKAYAGSRRGEIELARAKSYQPGLGPPPGPAVTRALSAERAQESTTHISIIDSRNNAVSLTCTIEQEFGSAVVAPSTGFLLNNELTDFGDPGTANEPRPGKRPRSSMSPTIVVQGGRPTLVTGGAGGVRIIEGTMMTIVGALDFGLDIAHAVDAERLDDAAGTLVLEDARVDPAAIASLQARGHVLRRAGEYDTRPRVQAAGYVRTTGERHAVSDSRTEIGSLAQRPGATGTGLSHEGHARRSSARHARLAAPTR
jgi:gamma-glutamyltranspeptidase / glutathione hydrolase